MTYQPRVASTRGTCDHLWTVEQYRQLIKARLIEDCTSSELIAGQIVCSNVPLKTACMGSVQRLRAVLQRCVGNRARVRSHPTLVLNHASELRPDLAILRGDAARYRYHLPTSDDVDLLLEVTSDWLTIDDAPKATVYAQFGLQDYWVLDVRRAQLHVFRQPTSNGYQQHQVLQPGQSVNMLAFKDVDATLQQPAALHFLTRSSRPQPSQQRRRHISVRLPLMITRHRTVSLPPTLGEPTEKAPGKPVETPLETSLTQPDVSLPQIASTAKCLPTEPQSVPSPRFLQPAELGSDTAQQDTSSTAQGLAEVGTVP